MTRKIQYLSPEQVFSEIKGDLKLNGLFKDNLLYRCFPTHCTGALLETGNDRNGSYNKSDIEYGINQYAEFKKTGIWPDNVDVENFEIMDKYGLNLEDFIFASREKDIQDALDYPGQGDYAFLRLFAHFQNHSVAIYDGDQFRELEHSGFEFLNKEDKLKTLVKLYDIVDEMTLHPSKINYDNMIKLAKERFGVKKTA